MKLSTDMPIPASRKILVTVPSGMSLWPGTGILNPLPNTNFGWLSNAYYF